jgi:surfeit locus 1 family protein
MPEYIPVLNFSRSRFAPRLGPTLLAASAIALFVVLGNWQLGRAHEKRQLTDRFTAGGPAIELKELPADAPRYQPVRLSGHYDRDHQFLLDNMSHESMAGVDVLTPFVLNGGSVVLVNRGWQPYGRRARICRTSPSMPGSARSSATSTNCRAPDLAQGAPSDRLAAPRAIPRMEELSIALGIELAPRQVLLDPAVPDDTSAPGPSRGRRPTRISAMPCSGLRSRRWPA